MNKIKELREEKGISVQKLADIIGINPRTIFRWEANTSEITQGNLIALADFFGCTTDELLGRENYGTGNVEILGEQLTAEEKRLLTAFRRLNQDGRAAFLSTADNLCKIDSLIESVIKK